jgi:hypothetical protein
MWDDGQEEAPSQQIGAKSLAHRAEADQASGRFALRRHHGPFEHPANQPD